MKRSLWIPGARLAALLLIITAFMGCPPSKKSGGDAATMKSMAVTMPKQFNDPPGADPSVSADMGGNGFEKIAADSGWKTSTLTADQAQLVSDSTAKKGGQITLGIEEFPPTFRTMGKDNNVVFYTRTIYNLMYESLLTVNPLTLDFLPSLASHWKVGPDNQTYYFRINPNARFSDGHPVTTADVVATYKLGSDPTILDPYDNTFYGGFDPPVVISKYIFSIRSKTNNWKNMFYFGGQPILPAHVLSTITGKDYLDKYQYAALPGTGPYVILDKDLNKGASVTLTRRSDWWGANEVANRGQYNFDKIKMVVVRDEDLLLQKFVKGELDFYYVRRASYWKEKFNIDPIQRGIMQKQKIFNDKPVGYGGIAFNTKRAPFNDPRMRRALTLLFNRAQLVEKLMYNEYILSNSYYPNSIYENPGNPKQEYNPEKAAQLLTEIGYTSRNQDGILVKNGQPLEVEILVSQDQIRILTPFQQDLQKAGIKLNFRTVDASTRGKMSAEKNYSMTFQQWTGLLYPNPISSFNSKLADVANTNNITAFKNARADELMDKEQITFDPVERVRILRELDSILVAENTYALAYHVPFVRLVYWNRFGQPAFTLGRVSDWEDVLAQWWFDPEKAAVVQKGMNDKSVKMDIVPNENRYWLDYDKAHPVDLTSKAAGSGQANGGAAADSGAKAPGKAAPSVK